MEATRGMVVAGDWIKLEKSTLRKTEVQRMARLLNANRYEIIGRLAEFWAWLDDVCVDGVVDGVVDGDVDGVVACPGFAAALEAVKWAEFDREKQIMRLPQFGRHNGETSKKRALSSQRQAKWRANHVDAPVDAAVDKKTLPEKSITTTATGGRKKSATPKEKIGWTDDGGFVIPERFLASFRTAYPAVDLAHHLAKAHAWCMSNPQDRPRSDFSRFLNRWFAKEQREIRGKPTSGQERLRNIMKGQA